MFSLSVKEGPAYSVLLARRVASLLDAVHDLEARRDEDDISAEIHLDAVQDVCANVDDLVIVLRKVEETVGQDGVVPFCGDALNRIEATLTEAFQMVATTRQRMGLDTLH